MRDSGPARPLPRLHVVTDDDVLGAADWPDRALAVVREGGAGIALHLRGPRTSGSRLHELAGLLRDPSSGAGALLVVNDRLDVALAHGITAVHLGGRSLDLAAGRALLGDSARVGVSCHSVDDAEAARAQGAEWIFAGTVFPTPSHPGVAGRGVKWVASAVAAAGQVPVVAIGGVRPDRVGSLRKAGAHGVAAIRGIWDRPDPAGAVREYIEALEDRAAQRGRD